MIHRPQLLLVGTDHRLAPLDLRERVAYDAEQGEDLLLHLAARPEVDEAFLLSTCNRTEVYLLPRDPDAARSLVIERAFTLRAPELSEPGRLFVHRDDDAARHLLAVACGLESMVLGEPEILGQVKQAATLTDTVGAAGPVLRRLVRTAVHAGKRARRETEIGAGAVSLGYTAVEIARNIFTDLSRATALVLGAGDTARMVTRNLSDHQAGGVGRLLVSNRSAQRTEAFREEFPDSEVVPFEERADAAARADLVLVATGAPEPVLTHDDLRGALDRHPAHRLLIVDLGVPRNVEPAVARLDNVFLHSLDSLEGLIDRNLKRRRREVPRVEELIEDELARFHDWYRSLDAEPLVARLQKQAEGIRRSELEAARDRFPPELHDDLDRLTRSLVRKILHHPSALLRGGGGDRRAEDDAPARLHHLELVRQLFGLDDERDP